MYWENYKGVALAKELRELAVILIATRGRQGYPIKDLVTRMQEITGVQLRKTLSRAVASIYDSGWLDVEYQKIEIQNNIIDIEKITFRLRDRNNKLFSSLVLKNIDFKFEFPKISSFAKNKDIKKYLNDNYSSEQDSYNSLTFIKLK